MRWPALVVVLGVLASVPARAEKCPNMLILLDRSTSMKNFGKWTTATTAINAFVPAHESVMRFGLSVFPPFVGDGCNGSESRVSCEFYNAAAIARSLSSGDPGGMTPTSAALDAAGQLPEMSDGTRRRFIILLTDGDPTCPSSTDLESNVALAEASLKALRANGIETFVIGFGQDVSPSRLDRMAAAGGVPRLNGTCSNPADPDGPRIGCLYYDASDVASLNAAFDQIASVAQGELQGNSCDDSCYVIGACPAGQRCTQKISTYDQGKYRLNLGECVADPCAGKVCGNGQYCREGSCEDACPAPCGPGQFCDRGTCVDDPCATGSSCVCPLGCEKFLVCLAGTCHDDPCRYVNCPSTAPYCDRGSCYPASAPLVPADAGTADAGPGGSGSGCSASGAETALPLALALLPLLAFRLAARRRPAGS